MSVNVLQLVDSMIDQAHSGHPGVRFSLTLADESSLFLDWMSEPRYRGCEIYAYPVADWLVELRPVVPFDGSTPAAFSADRYFGDLRSGEITTTLPTI